MSWPKTALKFNVNVTFVESRTGVHGTAILGGIGFGQAGSSLRLFFGAATRRLIDSLVESDHKTGRL